ncbi:hypothetical protein KFE98_18045 [bacterium SCSIO 12741]|nr:hypothetical protein KFE98_18045 [bacterium SCSIO 12741]
MRLLILLPLLLPATLIRAQSSIYIPTYDTPFIEGQTTSQEWSDHDSAMIFSTGNQKLIQIRFQRNDSSLFFIFMGNLTHQSNPNFPEIFIDLNYSRTQNWQIDDHWFHISATDCHFQGAHSDYSNCKREQSDWWGRRNWAMSAPDPDTVEIEIPFTKIGLDLSQNDTIGIAFAVTNTINRHDFWPPTATIDDPSTWGKAYFQENIQTGMAVHESSYSIKLRPNPAEDFISWNDPDQLGQSFQILDIRGSLWQSGVLEGAQHRLSVAELHAGSYVLAVTQKDGAVHRQRFIRR